MLPRAALIRKISDLEPRLREVVLLLLDEMERQREQLAQQVTKAEFNELKAIVAELAEAQKRTEERIGELTEAQKRTEERLTRLETTVGELAEAQKRSEERLTRLETTVAELIEAQKRSEERLTRLEATVGELIEAQKRTEERLNELAEAQKRTEERLNELAEAQKRTEEEVRRLVAGLRETQQRVEAISNTVGYTLEDRAIRSLPKILPKYGIEVEGELARKRVWLRGKERQINIYGHGRREGKPVLIVGEAKVRPSRKEVDRFVRLAARLAEQEGKEPVLLFVAYDFPLAVEAYLRERDILPIVSYQLDL